jgi:histone H3/H4
LSASEQFKTCSTCKKPILFGQRYFRCSVSTCNRKRLGLFFCTLECYDAHLPMMRHRDSWAEPTDAPSREEYEREQAAEAEREEREQARDAREERARTMSDEPDKRRIVTSAREDLPREVLVVVSKLKAYVKASSGMNTSDGVVDVLSDHLRAVCERAIENARADGRKTILDRDFKGLV